MLFQEWKAIDSSWSCTAGADIFPDRDYVKVAPATSEGNRMTDLNKLDLWKEKPISWQVEWQGNGCGWAPWHRQHLSQPVNTWLR